jgi:Cu+-exporting ATPase
MATDPICGMYVDEGEAAALRLVRENRTYYFCSSSCVEQFAAPVAELARLRRRLTVAWPLALAILVLTYLHPLAAWPYLAFGLATVVQFYSGFPFYRGFVDAVARRVANMDVLIAVGTTVAYLYSAAALFLPGSFPRAFFFDASATIIALLLTGSYLEHQTRQRATGAVRRLLELLPSTALVIEPSGERSVPLGEVQPGWRLRVRPGSAVPADGVVRSGRSSVNQSLLTGESLPVVKGPGDPVVAGSLNGDGPLEIEVTRVGADTFLAEVGHLLAEAETSRVPLQKTADRLAERFVPVVLVLAILAAVGWSIAGVGLTIALLVFVSVAITACPCAFGIATPAAVVVGTGRAAELGVLFRGSDSLERSARVDVVLTDKTGTLTLGAPTLAEVRPESGHDRATVLAWMAALEQSSEHPLATAVRAEARREGLRLPTAEDVQIEPGVGVRGRIGTDRFEAVASDGDPTGPPRTWSELRRNGTRVARFGFSDPLRPTSRAGVDRLRALGVRVVMVTGDQPAVARAIATACGIEEVRAGMTPADKIALVRALQGEGRCVAFVGDGVNDAPALAAADLGIALGTGTEVARASGAVLLIRPEFTGVATALLLGRRTVAKVRQNLVWALGYNSVLLPVAAGALVPFVGLGVYAILPMTGALAMGLSSTTVLLNSLSLRRAA